MGLQEQLNKYAAEDLAIARKTGAVCISGTKLGAVEVQYDQATRLYSAYQLSTGKPLRVAVPAGRMRELIICWYVVVNEAPR